MLPLLFLCLSCLTVHAAPPPRLGDAAPPIVLPEPNGAKLRVGGQGGPITVVDFSATWCGPCHVAQAALAQIAVELGTAIRLVVVDEGEDAGTVTRYYAAHPLPASARVVLDEQGAAGRAWGARRLPTAFLVDGRGIVRHIDRGVGPGYRARITRWLRSMLTI